MIRKRAEKIQMSQEENKIMEDRRMRNTRERIKMYRRE